MKLTTTTFAILTAWSTRELQAFCPSTAICSPHLGAWGSINHASAQGLDTTVLYSSEPLPEFDMPEEDKSKADEDEADDYRQRAQELRDQIREMEAALGDERQRRQEEDPNYFAVPPEQPELEEEEELGMSLKGKRVLVAGANGRLGSMVCRRLLRENPQTEVVAAVHVVGENSPTARGYGRLSYEVGAEDGVGTIGAAWSENRDASFMWDESMRDYNLRNLRIVECELLDPVQCRTVVEDVDAVIWCATDFNGNQPRAISSLNVAFLFRAVSRPDKGRVEVEGLQNMLGALKQARQDKQWKETRSSSAEAAGPTVATTTTTGNTVSARPKNDPVNFVLVSTTPESFDDFDTPFGSFIDIKRQGERMTAKDFPSLTTTVLQMSRYEDNMVGEDLELLWREDPSTTSEKPIASFEEEEEEETGGKPQYQVRFINRRDAARAAVDALTQEEWAGRTMQVWTNVRNVG